MHRGEVIGHRPFLGAALGIPVELVGLEGLASDDVVAEEFVAEFVEIILADAVGQILAPVILHPFEHQRSAGDKVLDAIGPRSQRRLQRGRGHVALAALRVGAFPPVFRQHVELAGDQRKLAIAGAVEEELDVVVTDLLGLDDMLVVEAGSRADLLELRFKRKNHVFRGHRLAVMPPRRRTQAIDHIGEIIGISDEFGQRAVIAVRLVKGRVHQRFDRFVATPAATDPFNPATTMLKLS